MEDRQPVFEFIHYPKFGDIEYVCPAVKIVYTLYSDEQTLHDMREQFDYFLKACSYHIPLDEVEYRDAPPEINDREVVIDVDQANTEESLKQKLIAMGWTPPFGYRDES